MKISRPRRRGLLVTAALCIVFVYSVSLLGWALSHAVLGDRYWCSFLLITFALYFFLPLPAVMLLVLVSCRPSALLPFAVAVGLFVYLYGGLFILKGGTPIGNGPAIT